MRPQGVASLHVAPFEMARLFESDSRGLGARRQGDFVQVLISTMRRFVEAAGEPGTAEAPERCRPPKAAVPSASASRRGTYNFER